MMHFVLSVAQLENHMMGKASGIDLHFSQHFRAEFQRAHWAAVLEWWWAFLFSLDPFRIQPNFFPHPLHHSATNLAPPHIHKV